VPNPINQHKGGFDLPGQISGIISIAVLAFSLIQAGKSGWFAETVLLGFCIFIITFITFLFIEQRATAPMFPLVFFRSRTFAIAIAAGMFLNIGFYGEIFMLPLYFQQLRGYSILMTGLAILPQTGIVAIGSYLGGKIASKIGPKMPMVFGLAIGAAGFFLLLIAKQDTAYLLLILPLIAIGFGTAFTMPAATIAVINSVPENRAGIASGALNASRQVGSLLGVAIFGTIISTATHFTTGMHNALLIGGTAFLCGCLMTLLLIKQTRFITV